MKNKTFMVCIAFSCVFQLTIENAADYGLKADEVYMDAKDGRQTWDTQWMGKVKIGDW